MRRIWKSLVGSECQHPHTLVVTSVGVRRIVCESCGHISFKMTSADSVTRRPIKKEPFKRAAGL